MFLFEASQSQLKLFMSFLPPDSCSCGSLLEVSDSGKQLAIPLLNSIHFIAWSTFMGPTLEQMDIWNSILLYRPIIIDTMWSEHMYTIKYNPHVL